MRLNYTVKTKKNFEKISTHHLTVLTNRDITYLSEGKRDKEKNLNKNLNIRRFLLWLIYQDFSERIY